MSIYHWLIYSTEIFNNFPFRKLWIVIENVLISANGNLIQNVWFIVKLPENDCEYLPFFFWSCEHTQKVRIEQIL